MAGHNQYQETLEFLYEKLPMFSHLGKVAYRADLNNIIALCSLLGNPERKFRSVHIAGTNGKGSVSHMLAAIFQEAGYQTGLYTSPHLKDFRERIRVNGEMVEKDYVTEFVARIKPVAAQIQPSFFEITVAMAFSYFVDKQVDIAIVETGLGGRLDSTNIIVPDLAVITNISYDHQNILGNSLKQIAREKAGIIKTGVPVVIGEEQEEVADIMIGQALQCSSPLFFADQEFQILSSEWYPDHLQVRVQSSDFQIANTYSMDLNGQYQAKNLLTVLSSCRHLTKSWNLSEQGIQSALSQVKKRTGLRGRWDHNESGIREICRQLDTMVYGSLHIVLGTVKDKDIHGILAALPRSAQYYFCQAAIPRALGKEQLADKAGEFGLSGRVFASSREALDAARENASPADLILVCGSCFVVGELI